MKIKVINGKKEICIGVNHKFDKGPAECQKPSRINSITLPKLETCAYYRRGPRKTVF